MLRGWTKTMPSMAFLLSLSSILDYTLVPLYHVFDIWDRPPLVTFKHTVRRWEMTIYNSVLLLHPPFLAVKTSGRRLIVEAGWTFRKTDRKAAESLGSYQLMSCRKWYHTTHVSASRSYVRTWRDHGGNRLALTVQEHSETRTCCMYTCTIRLSKNRLTWFLWPDGCIWSAGDVHSK